MLHLRQDLSLLKLRLLDSCCPDSSQDHETLDQGDEKRQCLLHAMHGVLVLVFVKGKTRLKAVSLLLENPQGRNSGHSIEGRVALANGKARVEHQSALTKPPNIVLAQFLPSSRRTLEQKRDCSQSRVKHVKKHQGVEH